MRIVGLAAISASLLAVTSSCRVVRMDPDEAAGGEGGQPSIAAEPRPAELGGPLGGVEVFDCPNEAPWSATITTTGDGFAPAYVKIPRGHVVMFLPAEGTPHNMVADDGSFRSGAPRDTACLRFDRAGTYVYHCEAHPWEPAGVVVVH